MSLVVSLLVLLLVIYLAVYIVDGIPDPFVKNILYIVVGIVAIISLFRLFGFVI